jgi:MFS family permease
MTQTTVGKFSGPVQAIGFIILIPSVFGILIGLIMVVTFIATAALTPPDDQKGAVAGVTIGFGLFFAVASFVSGLLGWFLIMRKKVIKCLRCGFTMNRG